MEFYVINITLAREHAAEFHIGEELTTKQRHNFQSFIYDDFPEVIAADT
jgi:hypothetical protein